MSSTTERLDFLGKARVKYCMYKKFRKIDGCPGTVSLILE